ncbi:MAG: hypothetical protein V4739_02805 [Pseudomonadota bacterium]
MPTVAVAAEKRSSWIGSPLFDLCFFFGSGALGLAVGGVMLAAPSTVLPLWFLWLWLVEGPHLFATWQRTYLDTGFRQQHGGLLIGSLAWLLPGPVLWGVSKASGHSEPFLLYLGAAALWSFHHTVRQYHGLLSIYQRLGQAEAVERRWDTRLLHGVLWGAFGCFQLAHPASRTLWGLPAEPSGLEQGLVHMLTALLGSALLGWLGLVWRRWRLGQALKPGLFALAVAVGTTLFAFFVIGLREPLFSQPLNVEQVFMAATAIAGLVHGLHYLGIVIATSRRRATAPGATPQTVDWLNRAPLRAYLVMVVASLSYLGLTLLRGSPLGLSPESDTAQLFLALYWGLFLHHFWLDQKIWRPSTDARLRHELGLDA